MLVRIFHMKVYHGTTDLNADKIVAEKRFIQSSKDTEWLGKGVYFFQYSYDAVEWAKMVSHNKNQKPSVIVADLKLKNEEILDLDDPEQLKEFYDFYNQFMNYCSNADSMKTNNGKNPLRMKRCYMCNLYTRLNEDVSAISYTFQRNNRNMIFNQNQRQICVKRNNIISEIRKKVE